MERIIWITFDLLPEDTRLVKLLFRQSMSTTTATTTDKAVCVPPSQCHKKRDNYKDNDSSDATNHHRHRSLYTFDQARRMARSYGFCSRQEFIDYDCPGAYALPKNPDQIWATEWQGWDDFLGTCPRWAQARTLARRLHLSSSSSPADAYFEWWKEVRPQAVNDGDPTSRLPFRPDLYYQKDGWQGWEDWLGGTSLADADGALDATSQENTGNTLT